MRPVTLALASLFILPMGMPGSGMGGPGGLLARWRSPLLSQQASPGPAETYFRQTQFSLGTRPFAQFSAAGYTGDGSESFWSTSAMAVDSKDTAHIIRRVAAPTAVYLLYAASAPMQSRAGFTTPRILSAIPSGNYQMQDGGFYGAFFVTAGMIYEPQIVVDRSDVVHVAWMGYATDFIEPGHVAYTALRVYHTSLAPGGDWTSISQVPINPLTTGQLLCLHFKLKLGADGAPYFALTVRENHPYLRFCPLGFSAQPVYATNYDSNGGIEILNFYDFAVAPGGEPTFIWDGFQSGVVGIQSFSSGLNLYSPYAPVGPNLSMVYDSQGGLHISWNTGVGPTVGDRLQYRDGLDGLVRTADTVPAGGIMQIDDRDQLHIFSGAQLGIFSRLRDPATGTLSPTFDHSAGVALSPAMQDSFSYLSNTISASLSQEEFFNLVWRGVVLSKAGRVHALVPSLEGYHLPQSPVHSIGNSNYLTPPLGGDFYARSLEQGLGTLNPAAMAGVFPAGQVNTLSGNLFAQIGLYSTSGVGPTQSLSLIYNSLQDGDRGVGSGWSLSADIYLIDHQLSVNREKKIVHGGDPQDTDPVNTDVLTLVLPDGRRFYFGYEQVFGEHRGGGGGIVGSLHRIGNPLDSEYLFTGLHGTLIWFNTAGRIRRIEDSTGNFMEFLYSGGNLTAITDMNGQRTTTLDYSGSHISSITDPGHGQYSLTYTGDLLSGVTFASGSGSPTYRFEYASTPMQPTGQARNLLTKFRTPRATAGGYGWTCSYHPNGRLASVQDPAEDLLSEGAGDEDPATSQAPFQTFRYQNIVGGIGTMLTDRRGVRFQYAGAPDLTSAAILDEAVLAGTTGLVPVSASYDSNGYPTGVGDRWGAATTTVYSDDGALLSLSKTKGDGPLSFQDRLLSTTLTTDGFNHVKTSTTYVTPTGGTALQARVTTYDYNSFGQLIQVTYPDASVPGQVGAQTSHTRYEYNGPRHQLSRITNEEENTTTFSDFDPLTGLARSVLRQGGSQPVTMAYDVMGNRVQQTMPQGGPGNELPGSMTTLLDGMYRVRSQIDAAGKLTGYQYDLDSRVVQVTPPAGGVISTVYDRRGFVAAGSSPDGSWSQLVDANGNVRRSVDPRGFPSNFSYDFLSRAVSSRLPGASTLPGGQGGGGGLETSQMEYDLFDQSGHFTRSTVFGATKRVARTNYDNRGRVRQTIAPDNATKTEIFYNELDQVIASQQVFGTVVQSCSVTFRDERDRVVHSRTQNTDFRASSLDQHSDTYTIYNRAGSVMVSVDPLGDVAAGGCAHKTTYLRDARERVEAVIDGKGVIVTQYLYGDDDLVREVRVPDPAAKTSTLVTASTRTYTGRKEILSERDLLGNGNVYAYASLPGQISTVTDAGGSIARTTYDPLTQRPDTIFEAQGTPSENQTRHTWINGLLTQTNVWNPESNAYDATFNRMYDKAGRLERVESPTVAQTQQIAAERYSYNSFGELNVQIAGTKVVQHDYNSLGQNTQTTWHGAYSAQTTRTYNGAGQIETVSDGALSKTMFYETWKGTPHTESIALAGQPWKAQTHAFDNAGNCTGFGDGEGDPHSWPVDENNRPIEVRYKDQTSRAISYTPGGQVDQEVLKNAAGGEIATTVHGYDSLSRRTASQTVQAGTGEVLTHFGWEYDARHLIRAVHLKHLGVDVTLGLDERGRPASESTPGNNNGQNAPPFDNQYGGDPTGNVSADSNEASAAPKQLLAVAARSATYVFSASGNRASAVIDGAVVAYGYNAANQLISETSTAKIVTHEYDEWGNEVKRTHAPAATPGNPIPTPLVERYGYNHLNLLSTYTNSATGANWQYDFYPTGERYGKADLNTNTSELYVPRFGDVATEYSKVGTSAPTLKNTYVQGLGIDSKQFRVAPDGSRRHYLGDHVGTVGMTLDDGGNTTETSVKDAWGVPLAGGSSERYSGVAQREVDTESGLVYMRHRMYDPQLGRFTQTDPILGNRPGKHYAYASNNPVARTDPRGLQDGSGNSAFTEQAEVRELGDSRYFRHPESGQWYLVKDIWKTQKIIHNGEERIGVDYTPANREPANAFMSTVLDAGVDSPVGSLIASAAMGNFEQAVKMTPFVGTTIGFVEAFTGEDIFTGQEQSWFQRGVGLLPGIGKGIGKLTKLKQLLKIVDAEFVQMAGSLGGKIYGAERLQKLAAYLKQRGFTLVIGDEFFKNERAAQGAFVAETNTIYLRPNATEMHVWHEMGHYLQYQKIGKEAYMNLSRVKKEQFVFDMLNNGKRWGFLNPEERNAAVEYIRSVGGTD